jgi:hypothetical protein
MHAAVAQSLWQSVTITPSDEFHLHRLNAAALPQACLQLARELHFRSSFVDSIQDRCPHAPGYLAHLSEPSSEGEDEDLRYDFEPFEDLAPGAEAVLRRLDDNQLHTFR